MSSDPARLVKFAQLQADRGWRRWSDRQIVQRRQNQERLNSQGVYLGYEADREAHQVRLLSGQVVDASSLTNAGQKAGELVATLNSGGWQFRTKPH